MKPRKAKPRQPHVPPAWPLTPQQTDPRAWEFNTRTLDNGSSAKGKQRKKFIRLMPGLTADDERISDLLAETWEARDRSPERNGVFVDNTPDWAGIALRGVERMDDWAQLSAHIPAWGRQHVMAVCVYNLNPADRASGEELAMFWRTLRLALRLMAREGL